jgi:hypothetical protein
VPLGVLTYLQSWQEKLSKTGAMGFSCRCKESLDSNVSANMHSGLYLYGQGEAR